MTLAVTPDRIEAAYQRLGYRIGWRFMTSPVASFCNPKVLLVSLNPSGQVEHGPRWSQEAGSAYVVEGWGGQRPGSDALQVQIQGLIRHLGANFEEVASAHFVPFRSQRWADLEHKPQALAFAASLWSDFIGSMRPEYVICLGTKVGEYIPKLFGVESLSKHRTGWGDISLATGQTRHGGQLAILPHLGTFKLFSRPECKPFLDASLRTRSLADA